MFKLRLEGINEVVKGGSEVRLERGKRHFWQRKQHLQRSGTWATWALLVQSRWWLLEVKLERKAGTIYKGASVLRSLSFLPRTVCVYWRLWDKAKIWLWPLCVGNGGLETWPRCHDPGNGGLIVLMERCDGIQCVKHVELVKVDCGGKRRSCSELNYIPSKYTSTQYLRMGLFLEIGFCRCN